MDNRAVKPAYFLLALAMLALSACGFQLRGKADLSFHTLYIQGPTLSISKALKKSLTLNGVNIVNDPEKAELMLEMIGETSEKRILSLSGSGRVREFELYYRSDFRLKDPASETWGTVQSVEGRRDFSYDDRALLAKQGEEERLNQDMRDDAVREILRHLMVQKPRKS